MTKARQKKPEAAATWEEIGTLTPWDQNPRINDHAVHEVAESIKRFGFSSPIVARREDGVVIAGHTRLKAAQSLGLDKVPVRYLDLDPADAKLLALADNKLGEAATWATDQLASIFEELRESGVDGTLSGFEDLEIAALLGDWEDPFAGEDPPAEIEDASVRALRAIVPIGQLDEAVDIVRRALREASIEAEVRT